jgi:hypothetical protein
LLKINAEFKPLFPSKLSPENIMGELDSHPLAQEVDGRGIEGLGYWEIISDLQMNLGKCR